MTDPTPPHTGVQNVHIPRNARRIGWVAFAFFALKGVAWLSLAVLGAGQLLGH